MAEKSTARNYRTDMTEMEGADNGDGVSVSASESVRKKPRGWPKGRPRKSKTKEDNKDLNGGKDDGVYAVVRSGRRGRPKKQRTITNNDNNNGGLNFNGKRRGKSETNNKSKNGGDLGSEVTDNPPGWSKATSYSLRDPPKKVSKDERKPPLKRGTKRDQNGNKVESLMCHQCQRNDKGRVVRCQTCPAKRFCIPCITRWYPGMTEEAIAEACPFCRGNCNCKACLRLEGCPTELSNSNVVISKDEKVHYSKYLLHMLIPFLKQFNQEQLMEKEIESKIRGLSLAEITLEGANPTENERVYCNNCRTSIVDFHRSCPKCSYDLCLTCCREIRYGYLQRGGKEVIFQYSDNGPDYLHGGSTHRVYSRKGAALDAFVDTSSPDHKKSGSEWKAKENGSIPCPPKEMGGCGHELLELRYMLTEDLVSDLVKKAEKISKIHKLSVVPRTSLQCCSCFNSLGEINLGSGLLRKAAGRENSNDNYLYCPSASDIQHGDLEHFQQHWIKGEPVIVSDVLDQTSGLSWEPMVMWRAFRQMKHLKHSKHLDVMTIDCLDWSEV